MRLLTCLAILPLLKAFQLSPCLVGKPPRSSFQVRNLSTDNDEVFCTQSEYIPLDCESCFDEETGNTMDMESILNIAIPAATPIVAFFTYEEVANIFDLFIDLVSTKTWVAVDGGSYQAKVIAPAVNGVIIPAIAVLFATLTSTTISTLRARQVDIRKAINMEAGELRALECLLESFPSGTMKDRCRDYLIQYTSRLIAESSPSPGVVNPRWSMDSELNAFMNVLNQQTDQQVPPHVLSEAFSSVSKLREQRQNRITALQSTYPALHYVVLAVLSLAVMIAFLMETDQEVLVFLNAIQLKILWSMLTGTFVACFAVFSDLRAPFSGSYQISACVDQLHTIRLALKASVQIEDMLHLSAKQQQQQRRTIKRRKQRKRRKHQEECLLDHNNFTPEKGSSSSLPHS